MDRSQRAGALFILIAVTGYGFFPVFTKHILSSGLPPLDIAIVRYSIAAPLMWLLVFVLRQPPLTAPLPRLKIMGMGVLLTIEAVLAFYGMRLIPGSTYVVIFYSYPAMVALLSFALGERLPLISWLALGLTLVGIVLSVPDLGSALGGDRTGVILAVVNALAAAVYFILSDRLLKKHDSMALPTAWTITGAFLALVATIPFGGLTLPGDTTTWLNLLGLATISTVLPVFMLNKGIQKLGPTRSAIIGTLEPVLAAVLSMAFLGERMTPVQMAGGGLILASVVILQVRRPPEQIPLELSISGE